MLAAPFVRCKHIIQSSRFNGKGKSNSAYRADIIERRGVPMKKLISILLAAALLCIACCSIAEEKTQPEILAVYSSPEAQIITNDDQSKELADTVIFLYQDHSYVQ